MEQKNIRKIINGQSDKTGEAKVCLHLNINTEDKIKKLMKDNFKNMAEMGQKFLPNKPPGINKEAQTEEARVNSFSKDLSTEEKTNQTTYFDIYQAEEKSQSLQFLPTTELDEKLTSDIKIFMGQIETQNAKNKVQFDKLIQHFAKIAKSTIKGSSVEVYGSYATDLCLPNSDIDLVVKIQNAQQFYLIDLLKNLETRVQQDSEYVDEVKCIPSASMPVLKVRCTPKYMNKRLDISIQDSKHNGLVCVQLVKDYLSSYEPLKPLTLVLKHFLHCSNLADPYQGGLSSYGLILMIVSFFQQRSYGRNNWPSLATLLLEFLQLYGLDLDYSGKVLCPQLPNQQTEFPTIYFDPQNIVFSQQQQLLIVDPLNKQNNVGRSTYLVQKLKYAFSSGFIQLINSQSPSPLKSLFSCSQNLQLSLQSQAFGIYKSVIDHIGLPIGIHIGQIGQLGPIRGNPLQTSF